MAYRVYNPDGISKTLAAVGGGAGAKTGLYAVKCIGNTNPCGHGQGGNVYSTQGLAPALMVAKSTPLQICMSIRGQKLQKQTCCAVLTPDREEKRQNGRRIKEPGEPSFTLTAQDRHGVALLDENIRIRRLTPRECWRLQGFPDEYFDKARAAGISDTQLYKQAGNGVTVNVARAIGEKLKEVEEHG